jgi:hypothetical protein
MKLASVSVFAFFTITAHANTEKVIFIAPPSDILPEAVQDLHLPTLTPSDPSLRAALPVKFPSGLTKADKTRQGELSWYLLNDLHPDQRYEVRICWAATQPTNFWIDTFTLSDLLADQHLLHQVTQSSQGQRSAQQTTESKGSSSSLVLRVIAAADFFTTNETLMRDPPSVDVDIILDPFLANVFPQSLLSTAVYIIILAIGSWFISGYIWHRLTTQPGDLKSHAD